MSDLILRSRRDLVTIVPNSDLGKKWLGANIEGATHGSIVTIQADYLNDFIELLKKNDIEYEEV